MGGEKLRRKGLLHRINRSTYTPIRIKSLKIIFEFYPQFDGIKVHNILSRYTGSALLQKIHSSVLIHEEYKTEEDQGHGSDEPSERGEGKDDHNS